MSDVRVREYEVEWETEVGMGYTFYSGTTAITSDEDAEYVSNVVRRKIARELDRRPSEIIIYDITIIQ